MTSIDLHIIYNPKVNKKWVAQSLKSAERYKDVMDIHITEYYQTNFLSRKHGFSYGNNEFVSVLDIDDFLSDDIDIPALLQPLSTPNICGVFTNSYIMSENGHMNSFYASSIKTWNKKDFLSRGYPAHQFFIIRRSLVELFYNTITPSNYNISDWWCDSMLHGWLTQFGDWHYKPVYNYTWRTHKHGYHNKSTTDDRQYLRDYYKSLI